MNTQSSKEEKKEAKAIKIKKKDHTPQHLFCAALSLRHEGTHYIWFPVVVTVLKTEAVSTQVNAVDD